MDEPQLSLNDLQEYRAYRVRLAQFLHFFLLYEKMKQGSDVPENVMGHKADKFANSLQVATLGWLASLVDTNNSALNVFRLWKRLFPARSAQIEAVEASIQPQLKTLIKFRNEVAFHANKSFQRQIDAYMQVTTPEMAGPTQNFIHLCHFMIHEEDSIPALKAEIASWNL